MNIDQRIGKLVRNHYNKNTYVTARHPSKDEPKRYKMAKDFLIISGPEDYMYQQLH